MTAPLKLHAFRLLALCIPLLAGCAGAQATEDAEDWKMFGRALVLVQTVTSAAASSDDPRAAERSVEQILSGKHGEANRLAGDILDEALTDMPAQYRGTFLAVARDMATIARRDAARESGGSDAAAALQARKDLAAMGLQYHDAGQFLEAVKRNDALAVELFLAGRGVNVDARDAGGRGALEIARAAGNTQMARLLARPR